MALVLRALFMSLHFAALPHAVDPKTGQFIHLHASVDTVNCIHESFEEKSLPGIRAASHSLCDGKAESCPFGVYINQSSILTALDSGDSAQLPPATDGSLPDGSIPFVRLDIHLLAPMNSPPA